MEQPALQFPPTYVTLKQLQDRRLKEQKEAAERQRLKQEEERLRHRPPPAVPKEFYHSKEMTPVQKPAAASDPVIVKAAAGDARYRGRSRAAASGSSLVAEALGEKGKEAAIALNPSPENAGGERDGDVTVHGGSERPVEGAGRGRRWAGGRGRGRNSRIEGLGGFQWRAVAGSVTGAESEEGLKVSGGDGRQAERNGVVAGRRKARGPMAGRGRWRALNGPLPADGRVVEVIEGNVLAERGSSSMARRGHRNVTSGSPPMDDEAVKVIEELKVSGGGDTQVERSAMVAGMARSSTAARGHPRVTGGSLPVVKVDEDSKVTGENVMAAEMGGVAAASELDQVVELAVAGDNVILQEGKAVMRKERGSTAGRGRGRNNGFQGYGRFIWRAVAGSHPVDGLVWVKKATVS